MKILNNKMMLITKDFIVINNPKTGSSFVRKVLKEIYAQREQEYSWIKKQSVRFGLVQPKLIEVLTYSDKKKKHLNQHGSVGQIPKEFVNNKSIVSVIRNPYSKLLSQYEFKWWQNNYHLYYDKSLVKTTFPHFPNLSLDEFIDFQLLGVHQFNPLLKRLKIGQQTKQFIKMFFNNPIAVIANINDDYILSGTYKKDLKPITFLQQENLTEDLVTFLSQYDFTQEELDFVKNHQRVNVTQDKHPTKPTVHTQKSLDYIKTYERLLFKIYEDLGIVYNEP